jgi:hypothetical protein
MSTAQQHQVADIVVQAVYPPKPGKQSGTLKTTSGELYGVWPDKMGLFQPGKGYSVQFVERPFKGKNYRSITKKLADLSPSGSANAGEATPQSTSTARPPMGEGEFVAQLMAACLQSQLIELDDRSLTRAATMFQALYRQLWLRH